MDSLISRMRYWTPEWARNPVERAMDSNRDLRREARQQSYVDTARFIVEEMPQAKALGSPFSVLDYALSLAPAHGLTAEFGVYRGRTLRRIARARPNCHGFDSFQGLPSDWVGTWTKGFFALSRIPVIDGAQLHVGWFDETLPTFLAEHDGPFAFVHLDADLYESTVTVLELIGDRLQPGCVVLFDEYFNYPGWRDHEHRAWRDFSAGRDIEFDYVAYNRHGQQLAIRIANRSG